VKSYTIDEIFNKSGWHTVDLIKMDIEGAELTLIPCSKKALARTKFLLIEFHGDYNEFNSIRSSIKNIFPVVYRINTRASCKPLFLFSKVKVLLPRRWVLL
jgi:hypothetical protein